MQRSGFASILVYAEEGRDSLSVDAFAPWHGIKPGEMLSFLRNQGFKCHSTRGPRRGIQVLLDSIDRQEFLERFISFRSLGVTTKMSWPCLRTLLEAEGIRQVEGSTQIYNRSDVAHLLR